MRKLLIIAALAATAHSAQAQQTPKSPSIVESPSMGRGSRIFAPQQAPFEAAKAQAQGGSFTVNCSQSFAAGCFKDYLRTFKVKKEGGVMIAQCFGGTVSMSVAQASEGEATTVEITIQNAAFSVTEFRNFVQAEILRGQFRDQKRILEQMNNRKARTEAENVLLERRIERLKIDIANAENKIQLNDIAIQKYETMMSEQQGVLSEIQAQIDELQQNH